MTDNTQKPTPVNAVQPHKEPPKNNGPLAKRPPNPKKGTV